MKLTVLQENLQKIVALSSHFTSPKAQLPILGNILLKAEGSKLILSSTNLEISFKTSMAVKIQDEGEITINGKVLNDIVSNLRPGIIELEVDREQVKLTSGKFKSTILGSNSADFPSLPQDIHGSNFALNLKELNSSLSKTLFAVSLDETRPILTGVLFVVQNKNLKIVSTDGFRLSEVKLTKEVNVDDLKIIVPRSVLYELLKISEDHDEVFVSYEKDTNQIIFKIGETVLSSRVIEGEFPDYEKIIPNASLSVLYIDKTELEKSIKLASVFARDSGKIIKLKIRKNEVIISAESSSKGNQEANIEIRGEDIDDEKEIDIMFNYSFIEDVLKTIEDDEVKIIIAPDNKACKFLDSKVSNFLHIIMPIKTN